jgi:hypothetical protein
MQAVAAELSGFAGKFRCFLAAMSPSLQLWRDFCGLEHLLPPKLAQNQDFNLG